MTAPRRKLLGLVGVGAAVAVTAACSGAPAPTSSGAASAPTSNYTVLTPAPTADAGDVVWATYRETQTLDPIQAFDYPENTIDPLLCDSLLRQKPDMTIGDGIASYTNPTPTEFDFTLNANAKFWDGTPVTSADAVFSLKRAADPNGGGFYAGTFDRVSSIEATGEKTFKIVLKQPDYWLLGELSATPGEIVEKKYAEAKGKDFGTVTGGTMCSGPFKLDSWKTGQGIKIVPNPDYWDTSLPKPRLKSFTLIGVPDDATLTAGLKTGSISGAYVIALSTLGQLETDPSVKVYQGAPFDSAAMAISATKGPLANPTVRQAVSYALDRKGIINTVWKGAGNIPHALMASGTWGTVPDVFQQGYDALPALDQDMTKAQDLIKQAGVAGQTITIGTSSGLPALNSEALAFKTAAEAVGLKVTLQNVSPSNYINYFIDPKAWGSVDAFATTNYGDYADPSGLYKTMALKGGSQNFSSWENADVTTALDAARSEADPTKRAQDVIAAQKIITDQQVWVPLVAPNNVLVMNKSITGAPATFQYMFGPWAVYLGGTGS
ncbi:MAG TPA: ABC transporter substrate-binding protein [Propionibacteriaceae bacterium]|nr:ABC transporter substrate-binding protein [Propionibacteriaceae bacterium]